MAPEPRVHRAVLAVVFCLLPFHAQAQESDTAWLTPAWNPDNGDGTYKNPVIYADYSDPDVVRVDDLYYMVASSFSHFPGLPILRSHDLVNWEIIGHALSGYPFPEFTTPQHGMAIWAPSIRFHNGEFMIYFGDPDRGIFMTKARNAAGPWSPLLLVHQARGWIDPCPFWDDDGGAYLVHAFANSRAGIKSILAINRMSVDGTFLLDSGRVVFDGHATQPTIEGPKLYKRNGYYYVFAPAGGVKYGWQIVLRSRNIYGPYEEKKILEQGSTRVNGPHQGAWVQTAAGEDWFMHFQDRFAYGRVVHLQPMRWEENWPVIGVDYDGNGIGEPVSSYSRPKVTGTITGSVPATTDEFEGSTLGLQWQWQANGRKEWVSLRERPGCLRFHTQPWKSNVNLYMNPALLMQKIPAPSFRVTAKVDGSGLGVSDRAGIVIFGRDYATLAIERSGDVFAVVQSVCMGADTGAHEQIHGRLALSQSQVWLRIEARPESDTTVVPRVLCTSSFSTDGTTFRPSRPFFTAREGLWVGAKIGFFAIGPDSTGFADFERFAVEGREPGPMQIPRH
jgi:beta-xylosidase